MRKIYLPYGKNRVIAQIEESRLAGILVSSLHSYRSKSSGDELVLAAMANPIGSERLRELARGKNKVVIVASDHTRPVPSKIIIPKMLKEIREGNPAADITILVATGCHRDTTEIELKEKFGKDIFFNEKIKIHDCDDTENLVSLGTLPSGGELVINRIAAEADLLVAEGFIEPHFFAGFSGGRKSILPGIASRKTVVYNHNGRFIADSRSRTGITEGNPINRDMVFAAKKARLAYIVNVVLNSEKQVIYAVAGDVEKAHGKGCEFLRSVCRADAVLSDIVISTNGGYPLDQNIYQSVKGMTAAEATVKPNGIIIMLAKADDGDGGKTFYETFRDGKDIEKLMDRFIKTPPYNTIADQWQSQIFARILLKATVIYVSDAADKVVEDMHMIPAHSVDEALEKADDILRSRGIINGSITVIPDGVSVIVV
ncbi:MAG: nickel-dependent lactate racemase [Oscillospiraceae bacterium]|nr:nickel-dependent lactate racemase [Oscillospiraceae bacterium]